MLRERGPRGPIDQRVRHLVDYGYGATGDRESIHVEWCGKQLPFVHVQ